MKTAVKEKTASPVLSDECIKEALEFYGIGDTNYAKRCLECARAVRDNGALFADFEKVFDTLRFGSYAERHAIREKSTEELFGKDVPTCVTSVIVLSAVGIHKCGIEKYSFDKEQTENHIKRINGVLCDDLKTRNAAYIRPSQMQWGMNFSFIRIIEVGRLQFEKRTDKDGVVDIHIPAGARLDPESVSNSLKRAPYFIEKYFGIKNPIFECESWLLSSEIAEIIPKNSNIALFRCLFDVTPSKDEVTPELLDYIWNRDSCDDFSDLKENTSLRREVKKSLISGKKFYAGNGVLKDKESAF